MKSAIELTHIKPITSKGLWKYLHERCISSVSAKKYLKEVHYRRGNKCSFALGFENDKGGYAIRNPYWKSNIGTNHITTFPVVNSSTVNLFEGFMDFLSSCRYFGLTQPRNTTIVLNYSTANLHHVLKGLKTYKQANVYFDNDEAGRKAKAQVEATGIKIYDGSKYYPNHNDFNAMLMDESSLIRVRA